jgi:hypothetical protein
MVILLVAQAELNFWNLQWSQPLSSWTLLCPKNIAKGESLLTPKVNWTTEKWHRLTVPSHSPNTLWRPEDQDRNNVRIKTKNNRKDNPKESPISAPRVLIGCKNERERESCCNSQKRCWRESTIDPPAWNR